MVIHVPRAFDGEVLAKEQLRGHVETVVLDTRRVEWRAEEPTHGLVLRVLSVAEEGEGADATYLRIDLAPKGSAAAFETRGRGATWTAAFDDGWQMLQRLRALDIGDDPALMSLK